MQQFTNPSYCCSGASAFKANETFARADAIRIDPAAKGTLLEDSKDGGAPEEEVAMLHRITVAPQSTFSVLILPNS
jgi:hypothetical protein